MVERIGTESEQREQDLLALDRVLAGVVSGEITTFEEARLEAGYALRSTDPVVLATLKEVTGHLKVEGILN